MKGRKFIVYILIAFIAGTILLLFIQYNSAKNISSLIKGNEKYMDEYNINTELKGLEKDLGIIESNISELVSTNDSEYIEGLPAKISKVQDDLRLLQEIPGDGNTAKEIDKLDAVVQRKLSFSIALKDSFYLAGKSAAEKMISSLKGKRLMDSVYMIVQNIENDRHDIIARLTISNDVNGRKAQQFNNLLVGLLLVCGAGLFWYIITTVKARESLIRQLHESEKKVKETAKIKEHFMANMSHEIRTPINAILGFTNLLQRRSLDAESKEYVETIQHAGENLLTIINDVLDLSKIEAAMMRIEATAFSIRGLVNSVTMMFQSKADEKGLKIYTLIDDSIPDILEGDATRLTQIFINLIGNALKFTKQGSVSVKLSNHGSSDMGISLGIEISDTGIGISKEKQESIFNRFQQADDTVTRNYGGTGLGLSIVKDLVLLQNGAITVASTPGAGATFTLVIPYKIAKQQSTDPLPAFEAPGVDHDFSHSRVLVVEDNEVNQALVRHLFKNWGLQYDMVNNGKEALAILQRQKYSLVLMDIQMPEMDGYTAAREIRETLLLATPIIAMTAHALAGEREKCLSYGMNDYISKPVREMQLHRLLARYTELPAAGDPGPVPIVPGTTFQYIDLRYMKEISGGDVEYEKTITEQFVEVIPEDLQAMEKAWQDKDIYHLRHLAHNMKTTVSVMGLQESLQPCLDAIEYQELNEELFSKNFECVKMICMASLEEAKQFYSSL